MRSLYTAIIHLREPAIPGARLLIEPMLRIVRGIDDVSFEPAESLITVLFDRDQTGLAEIVRMIEDCGPSVSGVAQRRVGLRQVG